jgi:hypothetical protein
MRACRVGSSQRRGVMAIRSVGGGSLFFSRFLFTGVLILGREGGLLAVPKTEPSDLAGDWLTP